MSEAREIFPVQYSVPRPGGQLQYSSHPSDLDGGGDAAPKVNSPASAYAAYSPDADAKEVFPVQGGPAATLEQARPNFGQHTGEDPNYPMPTADLPEVTALEVEHPETIETPGPVTAAEERTDTPVEIPITKVAAKDAIPLPDQQKPLRPKTPAPKTSRSATSAKSASAEKESKDDPETGLVF